MTNERESGQCSFQDDCSLGRCFFVMMYNRMEMRLGYGLFPKMKENIGLHLDLYVFPSFPGKVVDSFPRYLISKFRHLFRMFSSLPQVL